MGYGILTGRDTRKIKNIEKVIEDVSSVYTGDWAEGAYKKGYQVKHNGKIWIALKNTDKEPNAINSEDWVMYISDTDTVATGKVDKVAGSTLIPETDLEQITTNKNSIAILVGDGDGSIDAMINAKINAWAAQLTDDGIVNTYTEALNWIATHGSDYTALLGDVANKVEKVNGKGLSTNDLTDELLGALLSLTSEEDITDSFNDVFGIQVDE